MKLNVRAMALAGGSIWAGAVGIVAAVNLARPSYGRRFLQLIGSVYPGYHGRRNRRDVVAGTACAFADGAIAAALFAAVYNQLAASEAKGRSLRTVA